MQDPTYIVSEPIQEPEYVKQHDKLVIALREFGGQVVEVPLVPGNRDSVFMKDNAVFMKSENSRGRVLMTLPRHPERQAEQAHREKSLKDLGFTIEERAEFTFEGGDLGMSADLQTAFLGYGFRSDKKIETQLARFLNMSVLTLELTNAKLFHLDLVMAALSNGVVLACREALSDQSWVKLKHCDSIDKLIPVTLEEAKDFATNIVQVRDRIIMGEHVPRVASIIEKSGLQVYQTDLGHFHEREGSAACLVTKVH